MLARLRAPGRSLAQGEQRDRAGPISAGGVRYLARRADFRCSGSGYLAQAPQRPKVWHGADQKGGNLFISVRHGGFGTIVKRISRLSDAISPNRNCFEVLVAHARSARKVLEIGLGMKVDNGLDLFGYADMRALDVSQFFLDIDRSDEG